MAYVILFYKNIIRIGKVKSETYRWKLEIRERAFGVGYGGLWVLNIL